MSDWLWERKYEIDSLCYPVQFAYLLWKNTGRTDHFDDNFVKGLHTILNVWKTEQYHEEKSLIPSSVRAATLQIPCPEKARALW